MTSLSCPVQGCTKDAHRKGYCYAHYMKDWRYGTPTPQHDPKWTDIRGRRFGALVVIDRHQGAYWLCECDCGASTKALTGDLNRGSKISCGDTRIHRRTTDAGYAAAHQRVRQDRGSATQHECIGCGDAAHHWSYNHSDPSELLAYGISANPVAYSLNPSHYSPRCVTCHKRFDLGRAEAMAV